MAKHHKLSLFIFRRDLRLEDNTGLLKALADSEKVIPCFILDPRQLGKKNPYFSEHLVQFMVRSLRELHSQLKARGGRLYIFTGRAEEVVKGLIEDQQIDAVYLNRDYTPFSKKRDIAIEQTCEGAGIDFHSSSDILLNEPEDVSTCQGTPYTVFTPFYRATRERDIPKPKKNNHDNCHTGKVAGDVGIVHLKTVASDENKDLFVKGGRSEAKSMFDKLGRLEHYDKDRDIPALEATTGLSAHHKFGTVSIRESYHTIKDTLGPHTALLSQLYWRDFFHHVAFHFPHVFGHAFRKKYDNLKWDTDKKAFTLWCEGRTGFPIVDAGMRQLNQTGYMHNRVRMIVASFLTKDLHLPWQWGERYFAQKLVDYDPCVNNGSWQWAASTGCDAQPYFRVFNPWRQEERFDPEARYIKKWVPELKDIAAKAIHKLHEQRPLGIKYPEPIVEHRKEAEETKSRFKNL